MSVEPGLAILLFARAPQPGHAKTRLIPALGAHGAAALQANMTGHALAAACRSGLGDVQMWCTPSSEHPYFQRCLHDWHISLHNQAGHSLGERLRHGHDLAFDRHRRLLIMGTDCPLLTEEALRATAADLACHDAVIVPAEDGGYVLLALSRPCPQVFERIDWGSNKVFAQTLARLRENSYSHRVHPPLWDVDRPSDLQRLKGEMPELMHGI